MEDSSKTFSQLPIPMADEAVENIPRSIYLSSKKGVDSRGGTGIGAYRNVGEFK